MLSFHVIFEGGSSGVMSATDGAVEHFRNATFEFQMPVITTFVFVLLSTAICTQPTIRIIPTIVDHLHRI